MPLRPTYHSEKVEARASVTIIEMEDLDSNWATSIKGRLHAELGRLNESSSSFSCSIHRVPHYFRQYNEKAYDPEVISIGPFHYEKRRSQLQEMERHKWRYLHNILSRTGEGSLERYLVAVKKLEERARNCYSEVIMLDSYSFVEMMVLDACFVIEFIQRLDTGENTDDPIFQLEWLVNAILSDLLLFENQIPYIILQQLIDLTAVFDRDFLIKAFWGIVLYEDSVTARRIEHFNFQHLLHVLHTSWVLSIEKKYSKKSSFQRVPCASKLKEGGIKFKHTVLKADSQELLDIKFGKGVIEIPSIKFSDKASITLLNFIAFEQCNSSCKKYVTAYIAFVNCLISSIKDVEILCGEGIIKNWLGSDGDVATLFNNMVRELIIREEDFYLSGVCKEINEYCESSWPKMRATLVHDYFRNRWALISFCAALLLLLLTMTQTFFSSFPKFAYGK
ncbi:hypothetical protein AAC387_Pa06g3206 [Persea americana]